MRIPKGLAEELALQPGTTVELTKVGQRLHAQSGEDPQALQTGGTTGEVQGQESVAGIDHGTSRQGTLLRAKQVARRTYFPSAGDFVHLNFSPSAGHEMADRHYGLVISTASFSQCTGFAVVCPITSSVRPWPFYVRVRKGLLPAKAGVLVESVMATDQVKSVDCREREMEFVGQAPEEILDEVFARVRAIIDSDDVVRKTGKVNRAGRD